MCNAQVGKDGEVMGSHMSMIREMAGTSINGKEKYPL